MLSFVIGWVSRVAAHDKSEIYRMSFASAALVLSD